MSDNFYSTEPNADAVSISTQTDEVTTTAFSLLTRSANHAGIPTVDIEATVSKTSNFLKSKLKETGHGAKFLIAMGGIAPQLIINQDGNFDPKGLMIDVGETVAVAAIQAVPGVGPILSGVLSIMFQFLNTPKQQDKFSLLAKQLEQYVDEALHTAELEILQGKSRNLQKVFKGFSLELINFVTYDSKAKNPILIIDSLIAKKEVIFGFDIEECLTLEAASWSGVAYYAIMSRVKLNTLSSLIECDVFQKHADKAMKETLVNELDNFVYMTNYAIHKRVLKLIKVSKTWSDTHRGFNLCYTQGMVFWISEVNNYLKTRKKITLGNRLSCEIFSSYFKDKNFSGNFYSITQHDFFARSFPPAEMTAQWFFDYLLGLEFDHPTHMDGRFTPVGDSVSIIDFDGPPADIFRDRFDKDPSVKMELISKTIPLTNKHHGVNARVDSGQNEQIRERYGARGLCQFDISDTPAYLFEEKNGATKSYSTEPDSLYNKRSKKIEVGTLKHIVYMPDKDFVDHVYDNNFDDFSKAPPKSELLFSGNANCYFDPNQKTDESENTNNNGVTSFFLAGMFRGEDKYINVDMSAHQIIKANKSSNVGGFILRHGSSYDYKATIDGKNELVELDACCGLFTDQIDAAYFNHNDPFLGYKVIHVNEASKNGLYQIMFVIHKTSKKAITASINLLAGLTDVTSKGTERGGYFPDAHFALKLQHDATTTSSCVSDENNKLFFPGIVNDGKAGYTTVPFKNVIEFEEDCTITYATLESREPFLFCKLAFELDNGWEDKDRTDVVCAALGQLLVIEEDIKKPIKLGNIDAKYNFMIFKKDASFTILNPFGDVKIIREDLAYKFLRLRDPDRATENHMPSFSVSDELLRNSNPDSLIYFGFAGHGISEIILAKVGSEFFSYINYMHDAEAYNVIGLIDNGYSRGRSTLDFTAINDLKKLQTDEGLNRPIDSMCYFFGGLLVCQGNMGTLLDINSLFTKNLDLKQEFEKNTSFIQLLAQNKNKARPLQEFFPTLAGDNHFNKGVDSAVFLGNYKKGEFKKLDKLISDNSLSGNPPDGSGVFMFFKGKYVHALVQSKKEKGKDQSSISIWSNCLIKSKFSI